MNKHVQAVLPAMPAELPPQALEQRAVTKPRRKSKPGAMLLPRLLQHLSRPVWQDAALWRSLVRAQPIAMDCRGAIINRTTALPFVIRARPPFDEALYLDEIAFYTDFVRSIDGEALDVWASKMLQDMLDIPAGGNSEVVRWPLSHLPFTGTEESKKHATEVRGVPYAVHYLDGTEIAATGNPEIPIRQHAAGSPIPIPLLADQCLRIYLLPRTEWLRAGYGMAPPEVAFAALAILNKGDQYYASLLSDTPEAGVLDMGDMAQETAEEWAEDAKTLFMGTDVFKVILSYESTTGVKWVPFGLPPSELMYDTTTMRYAQIMAGSYGITLDDIGLSTGERPLAGQIRSDRASNRNGFATAKSKLRYAIEASILPPHLTFLWLDRDEDLTIARARARLANAQAAKSMIQGPAMTAEEWRAQMMADGIYTELDLSLSFEEEEEPDPLEGDEGDEQDQTRGDNDDTRDTMGSTEPKVAAEGGRTEVKSLVQRTLLNAAKPTHWRRILRSLKGKAGAFELPLVDLTGHAWWEAAENNEIVVEVLRSANGEVGTRLGERLYELGVLDEPQEIWSLYEPPDVSPPAGTFWAHWNTSVAADIKGLVRSQMDAEDPLTQLQANWSPLCERAGDRFEETLNRWAVHHAKRSMWEQLGLAMDVPLEEQLEVFSKETADG